MKVFFFFSVLQYHLESREVVRYFHARGAVCRVHLAFSGGGAVEAREFYENLGVPCTAAAADFCYEEARGDETKPPQPITVDEMFARLAGSRYGLGRLAFDLKRIARAAARYRAVRAEAEELLDAHWPDVVFQGSFFSCGRLDNALARLCHERGIPAFCLPYTPVTGTRLSMEGRLTNILCGMVKMNHVYDPKNWVHRLIRHVFTDWIWDVKGVPLLPFVDYELLGAWLAGIGEPWPWQKPSLHFEAFFSWTQSAAALALEPPSRYPAERVYVAGSPRLDPVSAVLADGSLAEKLRARLGVAPSYLLLHIPPSFEHRVLSREDHFRNVDLLCGLAVGTGRPVVVALHPLAHTPDYLATFARHGVAFERSLDITELISLAGLVVAHPSSTNHLTTTFQKPLVCYDLQRELDGESDWVVYAEGTPYRAWDEPSLRSALDRALADLAGAVDWPVLEPACPKIYAITRRRLGFVDSPTAAVVKECAPS
jgi:hypothetical protein